MATLSKGADMNGGGGGGSGGGGGNLPPTAPSSSASSAPAVGERVAGGGLRSGLSEPTRRRGCGARTGGKKYQLRLDNLSRGLVPASELGLFR